MEIGVPYQYDISKSLFTGALPGDSNLGQGFNGRTDGRGRTACTYVCARVHRPRAHQSITSLFPRADAH